jgi:carbon monoxide dehydrogenase subunit G
MAWIPTKTENTIVVALPRERVLAFLADIEGCGKLMPGLERIETTGSTG